MWCKWCALSEDILQALVPSFYHVGLGMELRPSVLVVGDFIHYPSYQPHSFYFFITNKVYVFLLSHYKILYFKLNVWVIEN